MGRLAREDRRTLGCEDFVSDAFRSLFDGPITIVPPCVEVQIQHHYERDAFDMDPGIFYFIFSFDYLSCPARKNPLGVLRAFQAAFPDKDERVGLNKINQRTRSALSGGNHSADRGGARGPTN